MATSGAGTSPSRVELPAPTGRYGVGRRAVDWVDHSRVEPYTRRGGARRVPAVIWYPTDPPAAAHRPRRTFLRAGGSMPWPGASRRSASSRIPSSAHRWHRGRALPGVAVLPCRLGAVLLRRHARGAGEPRLHRRRARPRPRDDPEHGLHRRPAPLVPEGRGGRSAHRLEASPRRGRPRDAARSSTPRPTTSGSRSISSLASTTTPTVARRTDRSRAHRYVRPLLRRRGGDGRVSDGPADRGVRQLGRRDVAGARPRRRRPTVSVDLRRTPRDDSALRGLGGAEDVLVGGVVRAGPRPAPPAWQRLVDSGRPGTCVQIVGSEHRTFMDWRLLPLRRWSIGRMGHATIDGRRMWEATTRCLLALFDEHVARTPTRPIAEVAAEMHEIVVGSPSTLLAAHD